jgi:hypothetical protein
MSSFNLVLLNFFPEFSLFSAEKEWTRAILTQPPQAQKRADRISELTQFALAQLRDIVASEERASAGALSSLRTFAMMEIVPRRGQDGDAFYHVHQVNRCPRAALFITESVTLHNIGISFGNGLHKYLVRKWYRK